MSMYKAAACVLVAGLIAGCASSRPSQYFTLVPTTAQQAAAPAQNVKAPKFAISVQSVSVPEQVDRPQIVVSSPGSAEVVLLNGYLWAAPLADEIRNALAFDLSRQLGVLDIASAGVPASLAVWKIQLSVQRFESIYNERAVVDATWRLVPVNQPRQKMKICRAEASVRVGEGMAALVEGHQAALHRIATLIADQLRGGGASSAPESTTFKGCTA